MNLKVREGQTPELGDMIVFDGKEWVFRPAPTGQQVTVYTNTIPEIRMKETRSTDFVSGSAGWCIYPDGSAEFNDIVARGTVYATAGEIGGWTIKAAYIAKDTGTDADSAGMAPGDYPFYAGATYTNRASAPFRVTPAGALVATSATITGSITATTGSIGGWSISATALTGGNATLHSTGYLVLGTSNDIVRIDAANATYRLWIGHATAGSAPFRVQKDGTFVATSATITGTITATAGAIGGWAIAATTLTGGNATLDSTGVLTLGTGSDVVIVSAADATYRLWAGHATAGSAPFRVGKDGSLVATSATITGSVTATSGTIGGWTIGANDLTGGNATLHSTGYLSLGTGDDIARMDAADALYRLWIGNAAAASAPFWVNKYGELKATNVTVTGAINTAVFHKNLTSAMAGSVRITKSSARLDESFTVDAGLSPTDPITDHLVVTDPPGGGWLFETSDRVFVQCESGGTVYATWVIVTRTATTNEYTATYESGSLDFTYPDGSVVLDYGASGDGYISLSADATNAPLISIHTHAGSPWTTTTERMRFGNLNGNWGYSSDIYGIALGHYASNVPNLTWDPTNGLRLRTHSTDVIQFDVSGNADITGKLRMPGASSAIAIGSTPPTASDAGTGIWIDRTGIYGLDSGTQQFYLRASDGTAVAGGGDVTLDNAGITFVGGDGNANMVKWTINNLNALKIHAYQNLDDDYNIFMEHALVPSTDESVYMWIRVQDYGSAKTGVYIGSGEFGPPAKNAYVDLYVRNELRLGAFTDCVGVCTDLRVQNGLWVGSIACDPDDNDLHIDGSINKSTALGCLVYHNASRSIAHNVPTTLNFNSEIHDTDGIHDTTSGVRHKFTAKHAGYYIAGASVRWDGSTASRRMALIACLYDGSNKNLARNDLHTDQNAVAGMSVTTGMFYLDGSNDYVYFNVYQDSGDYMDIRAASTTNLHECSAWLVRVA